MKTATKSFAMPNDKEPLALLAFKIMDDPFVGTITFCRIYSGVLLSAAPASSIRRARRRSVSAACC